MIGLEAQRLRVKFENVFELNRGALREESRCVFYGSHCDNAGFDRRPSGRSTSASCCRCSVKRRPTSPVVAAAAGCCRCYHRRRRRCHGRRCRVSSALCRGILLHPREFPHLSAARVSASRGKSMMVVGECVPSRRYDSLSRKQRPERGRISEKIEIKKTRALYIESSRLFLFPYAREKCKQEV